MRIRHLALRNFGLYRGEQILDFAPRVAPGEPKTLVLVGGHNGAGKTTILDAVRICLYGRLALGMRVAETEYQAYLRDRIHRSRDALIPVSYASVAMEFEYAHAGRRSVYLVQRAWEARGSNGVSESLRVLRDGAPLADVESQFWPEFVRSLVPPGVSQLFFFDGEKIKRLAEEESEAETLAESIKALLGLDLVERLQADLDLYNSRYLKKTATGALAVRLAEIEATEEKLRRSSDEAIAAETEIEGRLADLGIRIERVEQKLAQRGEGLSAQRGDLRERKATLELRRDQVEKAIRDLCEGPLPFALCPALSAEVLQQLEKEDCWQRWDATRGEVDKAFSAVSARFSRGALPRSLGWNATTRAAVKSELARLKNDFLAPPSGLSEVKIIHGLSERAREQARNTLELALNAIPNELFALVKDLNAMVAQLQEVQGYLNRAPEGDEVAPIVKELSALQEEHANLSLELKLNAEQRARISNESAALSRERARIVKSQEEAQGAASRLALSVAARRALDVYLDRLTAAKVSELETVALECFRTLCRKGDLVNNLTIDPQTMAVTLFDSHGDAIPKASLSAGEKQIYAISLLWALARVSGRALPVIIDTPLGRLDSVHRRQLLERYFPVASHQVIVLSTDTEVDRNYFDMLKPHTSHSVHLVNHGSWTEATSGYFWEGASSGVRAIA